MANIQADDIVNGANNGPAGFSRGINIPNRINLVSNANYTITTTDGYEGIMVVTGNTGRTITLPAVASSSGRLLTIKKTDSGTGAVTITPNGGTIDGASTNVISTQYGFVTMYGDGSNWNVINAFDLYQGGASATNQPTAGGNTYFDAAVAAPNPGTYYLSGMVSFIRNGATVTSSNLLSGYGTTAGNNPPNITIGSGSAVANNQQISAITAAGWAIINLPLPTIIVTTTAATSYYVKGLTDAVSLGNIQYAAWVSLARFK